MLLLVSPVTAPAQLSVVEKLFDNFTDFGVFVVAARYVPNSNTLTAGKEGTQNQFPLLLYGAEFSWQVGEVKEPICARDSQGRAPTDARCVALLAANPAMVLPMRTCAPDPAALTEVRVNKTAAGGIDTTFVYGELACTPANERTRWLLEMALAYVQSTTVYGRDAELRLRGVYKEIPRLAIYASYQPTRYSPYVGLFFGLTKLDDLRMAGVDSVVTGSAESAAVGAAFGVAAQRVPVCGWIVRKATGGRRGCELPFTWFLESAYTYSAFPTIKWSRETGWLAGAPRRLDLSSMNLSFGLQLTVREKK